MGSRRQPSMQRIDTSEGTRPGPGLLTSYRTSQRLQRIQNTLRSSSETLSAAHRPTLHQSRHTRRTIASLSLAHQRYPQNLYASRSLSPWRTREEDRSEDCAVSRMRRSAPARRPYRWRAHLAPVHHRRMQTEPRPPAQRPWESLRFLLKTPRKLSFFIGSGARPRA
jgi:hypothetical protein